VTVKPCPHHWIIGDKLNGKCKLCGLERSFRDDYLKGMSKLGDYSSIITAYKKNKKKPNRKFGGVR